MTGRARKAPRGIEAWRLAAHALVPYVVVARHHARGFRASAIPWLARAVRLDPGDLSAAAFLAHIERLDELVYGPRGLALPRWALYDCALAPGVVVGLAARERDLGDVARVAMAIAAGGDGARFVPLSACTLVPMMPRGAFWCDALASLNQAAPGSAPAGLRRLSLVYGLAGLETRVLYAATQWRSPSVEVYASLGSLRVESALTPAHARPATLVLRADAPRGGWAKTLERPSTKPRTTRLLDADDLFELTALQDDIERGKRVRVVGAPTMRGATVRVPLWVR
jgi:hypothetical protein